LEGLLATGGLTGLGDIGLGLSAIAEAIREKELDRFTLSVAHLQPGNTIRCGNGIESPNMLLTKAVIGVRAMVNQRFLHETWDVERSAQRFRELIIYVSQQSESDPWFGAVKLNKILYHSDFTAFERFGVPLTGVRYFRLPQGPAPKKLKHVERELVEEGAIRVDEVSLDFGRQTYLQKRTIALRDPIMVFFTADEIAIVDKVIEDLWNQNATEVSNASHDVRWRVLQHKDPVPYEFAYLSDDDVTEAQERRTRELAAELGW
jgi:hypothetical protein